MVSNQHQIRYTTHWYSNHFLQLFPHFPIHKTAIGFHQHLQVVFLFKLGMFFPMQCIVFYKVLSAWLHIPYQYLYFLPMIYPLYPTIFLSPHKLTCDYYLTEHPKIFHTFTELSLVALTEDFIIQPFDYTSEQSEPSASFIFKAPFILLSKSWNS